MKKYYCPNFSLPTVKQEFNTLSNIVGEDYAYYLWNKNKGLPLNLEEKDGKEVTNNLYNNLLNAFNGDIVKATYSFIIPNSSAFKKANKGYDKMSPLDKANAIHKFINSSEKGIEELGQSIISNLPKGFRAEFYQSGGFTPGSIVIDRKALREKKKAVVDQTESLDELQESPSGRQLLESVLFARGNKVANKVRLVNMQRVVGEGKFAEWTRNAIILYKGSDFTDVYHESWHEFTQRYLTKAEKIALYSVVKNRPGTVTINGSEVPHYALTNRQAEEVLAEEFRQYALDRQANELQEDLDKLGSPKTEKSVKGVFQGIIDFFKNLFGGSANSLNPEAPLSSDPVMELFTNLFEGKVESYKPSTNNITEDSLKRSSKELELSYEQSNEVSTATISSLEMAEIFEAIDFWMAEELEQKGVNFSFLLNSEMKETYLPQIYSGIKERFELYVDELISLQEEAENTGDDTLAAILENRYTTISWILAESSLGDNWQKVVRKHQEQSKSGVLLTNTIDDSQNIKSKDQDQREDDFYDETEGVRKQENWEDVSVNPEELASPTILEMLRKLPNVDKQGNIIYSTELGLPTLADYKATKNLLFNRLNGIQNYNTVVNTLKGLSEYAPHLQFLIKQLPDPNNPILTPEELSLKAQFMQSFTMSKVDPYSVKLVAKEKESSKDPQRMQTTTFMRNSLSTDTLLEYFDQDFRENSNRRFRTVLGQDETPRFDLINAYNTIMSRGAGGISSDRDHLEFYKDMYGVDLIQGNEDKMFNKKGDFIKGSVPYLNLTTLTNLRNLAQHSFNKLTLIYKIAIESNAPNQAKVPASLRELVSSNIESPFSYFATDINKNLQKEINKLDDNHPIKKFYKDRFKQTTTYSERKYVFDTISFIYNTMESASFLNGENNLEWSIKDRNHILSTKEKINSVENIKDLPIYLHPDNFKFANYSVWYKRLFGEDGNRLIAEDGQKTIIQILNFSDLTVGKLNGQKTTNLTADDKYIQDLLSFIVDGVVENLRFGSKSSSFASVVGNNRKERVYYGSEDFKELTDGDLVPSTVRAQFLNYLRFEVARIQQNKEGKTNKEKLGSRLFIFKDILADKNTIKEIEDIAKNAATEDEALKEFNNYYRKNENRIKINNALENYFKAEVKEHKQILADILSNGDTKKVGASLASLLDRPTAYTETEVDQLFSYYLTNYMTHQIEFTNIMVGDVSNYQIKSEDLANNNFREVFKRLGLSSSPGKEPLIDQQDLDSRNSNPVLGRSIEDIFGNGSRPYTKEYNIAVAKDVKTFNPLGQDENSPEIKEVKSILREDYIKNYAESLALSEGKKKVTKKYLDQAEQEIGESVDAFLNQGKESDAQAYATIDFIRFYLDSIGEWTIEMEESFQHEIKVAKAIKDYRTNPTPENRAIVDNLIEQTANKGIITSLKLGHYGEVASKSDELFNGKYSVFPLTPSAVFDTDQEARMIDMYQKGIDFITFQSGAKMALPAPLFDYYKGDNENAYTINEIPEESVFSLNMQGLRRQQYIAPKFKNKSTLSTQLVKLLFSNFYSNGKFDPEMSKIKGLQSKIDAAQQSFINNLELIVNNEKNRIYAEIGATLDSNGNLDKLDYTKFEKWLKKEFDKKDISPSLYNYVTASKDGFIASLDASPQRSVLESIIATVISKRMLRPDLNGEAYIQLASTGFNQLGSRYRKLSPKEYKQTLQKNGLTGLLQDYRIEDGVTKPADVAVSFNPAKHGGLLNLTFDGNTIETISKLNEILLGDTDLKKAWLEEHHDKLVIVGVRIPVQGFNSMEYFKVKKFLPTVSGPVIIVPPSIVTKSGSDFDIDKLFMYEPTIDENGNLIDTDVDLSDKQANLEYAKQAREAISQLMDLKKLVNPYKTLASNVSYQLKEDREYAQKFLQELEDIKGKIDNPQFFDNFDNNIVQLKLKIKLYNDRISRIYDKFYKNNPEIKEQVELLNKVYNTLDKYQDYNTKKVKQVATNRLIKTFESVLSEPSLYKFLTKPNDSTILRGLAGKYLPLKSVKNKVTSTSMFLPRISLAIYEENALGKKALGIDAKTNALHKLFQQVGLRITDENLNNFYLLKSNKFNGEIVLGGLRDADSNNYISDIINEFINGHVDIEKEDWINYFNADRTRTPIILQMILAGTPIEDALILVNQPIIQHYIATTRSSKIKKGLDIDSVKLETYYTNILRPLGLEPVYKFMVFSEIDTINMILSNSSASEAIKKFNSGRAESLRKDSFIPEVNVVASTFNTLVDTATKGDSESKRAEARIKLYEQLALFTQYRIASMQNEKLLELTQAIDFNTSKYATISDFYTVENSIKKSYEYFNAEAIDKIVNNSVVSPFNVTKESLALYNNMFDVISDPIIQNSVEDFLDVYGKYFKSDRKKIEISNYLNGLVHAVIQYQGQTNSTEYYNEFGPLSDYLTKSYDPKKSLDIALRKLKSIDDPKVKSFFETNLLFKNLTYSEIPNTGISRVPLDGTKDKKVYNKIYFKVATNDKDPDTVAAIQKAWLDAYNFAGSTAENNEAIREFVFNLAQSTIYGQGYTIKYKSLQPFIPNDILRIDGALKYFKDLNKAIKSGNTEVIDNFKSNILTPFHNEYTIAYDRSRRKNYTPFKKNFPNYVAKEDRDINRVINISAASRGFSAMLTNPTELAVYRGNIKEGKPLTRFEKKYKKIYYYIGGEIVSRATASNTALYPIVYKGKLYADVEAAYQDNKKVYLLNKNTNELMAELLTLKLSNYPELIQGIYSRGGEEYLDKAIHRVKGDKYWESDGENMFIKTLKSVYNNLIDTIDVEDLSSTEPGVEEYEGYVPSEEDFVEDLPTQTDFVKSPFIDQEDADFEEDQAQLGAEDTASKLLGGIKRKKKEKSNVDRILDEYSKEALMNMTPTNFINMGLSQEEVSELMSKICML